MEIFEEEGLGCKRDIFIEFSGFRYHVTEIAPNSLYIHGSTRVHECPSFFFQVRGHSVCLLEFVDFETVCSALEIYAENRALYFSGYREAKFWNSIQKVG